MSTQETRKDVIGWWSGGVTSAVAVKLAIDLFGADRVRPVFIDTNNEDEDTYRFQKDCEEWYQMPIETISVIPSRYNSIQEVWRKHLSLNIAGAGASCSLRLKRYAREDYQKHHPSRFQVFGFDIHEPKRARAMALNNPAINPIFPLLHFAYSKNDALRLLGEAGIEPPRAYRWGFHNNNCLKTGCVQGGVGYWQKMQRDFPEKFLAMAKMEHELTNAKAQPVTMLKDQGKNGGLVFLLPHPDYPNVKDLSMMKGREPKPLLECNGFCGTNDLSPNGTEDEINFGEGHQSNLF